MKKTIYHFSFLITFILCFAQVTRTTSVASTYSTSTQGQVNVGITFEKDDSFKQKSSETSEKKNNQKQKKQSLPKTGELQLYYISFIGLLILIISIQILNKKRR